VAADMGKFMKWFAANEKIMHPVEFGALAMFKFLSVHPFVDGNGRMGRVMLNLILYRGGYPMVTHFVFSLFNFLIINIEFINFSITLPRNSGITDILHKATNGNVNPLIELIGEHVGLAMDVSFKLHIF
jgi:hypothetical protein